MSIHTTIGSMNASGRLIIDGVWDDEVRVWVATSDESPVLPLHRVISFHVRLNAMFLAQKLRGKS